MKGFAQVLEFSSACASDKPAIPEPIIATFSTGFCCCWLLLKRRRWRKDDGDDGDDDDDRP